MEEKIKRKIRCEKNCICLLKTYDGNLKEKQIASLSSD